jgi:hypothetical protein
MKDIYNNISHQKTFSMSINYLRNFCKSQTIKHIGKTSLSKGSNIKYFSSLNYNKFQGSNYKFGETSEKNQPTLLDKVNNSQGLTKYLGSIYKKTATSFIGSIIFGSSCAVMSNFMSPALCVGLFCVNIPYGFYCIYKITNLKSSTIKKSVGNSGDTTNPVNSFDSNPIVLSKTEYYEEIENKEKITGYINLLYLRVL